MPRFSFAHLALMSCALLAGAGCGGNTTGTGGTGPGGSGGSGGSTDTGGSGGSGGAACVPEAEQCDGADNDCDGSVDEDCPCIDGETQPCYSGPRGTDGVGTCAAGTQTCDLTGTWGACAGEVVPKAEECNSLDDDCNGAADDMGTLTCGVGACMSTVPACDGGTPGACVPGMPSLELCDGIDNNCNQLVDETFPNQGEACDSGELGACQAGTMQCVLSDGTKAATCVPNLMPELESCDGVDNDCNGAVDDDVPGTGGACSTGLLGPCDAGTIACQNGTVDCFPDFVPGPEICGDDVDNDCNGTVDDAPGVNMPCDTGLLGACSVGLMLCNGGTLSCVQQEQAQPTDMCGDNKDNDCDGTVDEGCLYTFSGVQNNVPIANLTGWTQCFVGDYGTSASLATVLSQCSKANLLLGCRTTGSTTLAVAAHAPKVDVIFETGTTQTPHDANGVGWYYTNSYSWGFAPQGSPINRNSCDIVDSQTYPGGGATDGALRICWHTSGGNLSGGWRCGKPDFLGSTYERLIFHAD